MNTLPILNNKNDTIEFEEMILKAQVEQATQELKMTAALQKGKQAFYQKLFNLIAQRVGHSVTNKTDAFTLLHQLPPNIQHEIYDEAMGKQHCLIRPSHAYMPYSFTGKKPELEKSVPMGNYRSPLELLSDRSNSRAFEIIREYTSENTCRAHTGDLVYFQAWLSAIGFSFYEPVSEKELITFIIQHAEGLDTVIDKRLVEEGYKSKLGPHKLSTIKRRIASLSVFLESVKWHNPCHNKEIKELLSKLTKKYGSSRPAGRAITKDILDDMLDTCNNKLLDLRDRALLLFAWGSGGRRRSEVVVADMKDLTKTPYNDFVYNIPHSKTDQTSKGNVVPVKGRAAQALNDWLTVTEITEGPIFRTVAKGGKLRGALSDTDLYRIVKSRLKKAGYDETQFGAHGLRSGFVTEAGRRGKPLGDVMQLTTHRNVATVMKYYQAGNISNNSAANLAD